MSHHARKALRIIATGLMAVTSALFQSPLLGQSLPPAKCERCGTLTCEYVVCCEIVEKTKKGKKTTWSTDTEYVCTVDPTLTGFLTLALGSLPGGASRPRSSHPDINRSSDPSGLAPLLRPGPPRPRRKLLQHEEETTTTALECRPQILCTHCAGLKSQAPVAPPPPKPAIPDHFADHELPSLPSPRTVQNPLHATVR